MIVIVLGMHKSGTTLIAKTLHQSGINMGVGVEGDYPRAKYEDSRVAKITKQLLYGGTNRHSLALPDRSLSKKNIYIYAWMQDYIIDRCKAHGTNWGFKFPDVTLCYDVWRRYLPYHRAIGVRRNRKSIISHYLRQKKQKNNIDQINRVCDFYENKLYSYNCPVIDFDDYMDTGPIMLKKILGIDIVDCRRPK